MGLLPFAGKTVDGPGKLASRAFQQGIYRYCQGKLASKSFKQGIYRYCHCKQASRPSSRGSTYRYCHCKQVSRPSSRGSTGIVTTSWPVGDLQVLSRHAGQQGICSFCQYTLSSKGSTGTVTKPDSTAFQQWISRYYHSKLTSRASSRSLQVLVLSQQGGQRDL
jgi:hypothetical protein